MRRACGVVLWWVAGCFTSAAPEKPATRAIDASLAPPQLVRPLSTSSATSQRPTLHWRASAPGTHVEICAERACTHVIAAFDATGDAARPPAPLPPGTVYWRARGRTAAADGARWSPTWQVAIPHREGVVDTSRGTTTDFDGDGRADAILASSIDANQDLGYHRGTARGIHPRADALLAPPSDASASDFGTRWASVGDVDGDGFADLAVAADKNHTIYVYRGGPTGPTAGTPPLQLHDAVDRQMSVVGAVFALGDLDGDGYADFVSSARWGNRLVIYRGGPQMAERAGEVLALPVMSKPYDIAYFGDHFAAPGDIDGDGFDDLVVPFTDSSISTYKGYIALYRGGAKGFGKPEVIETGGDQNRMSNALGDLDGDGRVEVAFDDNHGRAMYHVGRDGLARDPAPFEPPGKAMPDDKFGHYILAEAVALGDANGDGYDDALLVVRWFTHCEDCERNFDHKTAKHVFLYAGSATGPHVASELVGDFDRGRFDDETIDGIGDLDGDGLADAILDMGNGSIRVYRGTPHGLDPVPLSTIVDERSTRRRR